MAWTDESKTSSPPIARLQVFRPVLLFQIFIYHASLASTIHPPWVRYHHDVCHASTIPLSMNNTDLTVQFVPQVKHSESEDGEP